MIRKSLKWSVIYTLEAIAIVLALVIFGTGAVLWRLSSGPVELDFLREDAQRMLAETFEGDVVALGTLEARYDPSQRALIMRALDVTVAEASGEVVTRAPLIEAGLAVDALVFGRIEPVSLSIEGGSVSIVRRADGAVGVGLGTVERVAETARVPARGGDESASLFEILADPEDPTRRIGRLRQIEIQRAAVRIVDEIAGIAWLVDDAGVSFDRNEQRVLAEIDGRLATPSGYAGIELRLQAGAQLDSLLLEASLDDLSPAGVLPGTGPLSNLRGLDAPVQVDFAVDATRESGIRSASFILEMGEGQYFANGEPTEVYGGVLAAEFDPVEGVLVVREGEIDTELAALSISGRVSELRAYVGALPTEGRFDISMGQGFVNLGDVFERPPRWESLEVGGQFSAADYRIDIERMELAIDTIEANMSGSAWLSETESGSWLPNLQLSGPIAGDIEPETVLAYWPVELADGAREWVVGGILGGRFYGANFEIDLDAGSIEAGRLANERMTLSFEFENADVRYISTMSHLTRASGSAVLRGNAFEVDLQTGWIGDIELTEGFVDIPRLNPKGAMARYGGVARGRASDILALIDEPPLYLPSDYGIDPALVSGEGEMRFEIRRPMLSDVPPEDIPFFIEGAFTEAALNIPGSDAALTEGTVYITASQDGLSATGDARLFETPVEIEWTETFGLPNDAASTRIRIGAEVGTPTLDAFNLPARRYLDGVIGIQAEAISDGLDIRSVEIRADLGEALLEMPLGLWSKEIGTPGEAMMSIETDAAGTFLINEASLTAEGLDVRGDARFARDGRLLDANFERIFVDGLADIDGRLEVPDETDSPIRLRISGRYVDGSALVPQFTSFGEGGSGLPVSADIDIARLIITENYVLDNFSVIWRSETAGIRAVSVSGQTVSGPFQSYFGAAEEGDAREFRLVSQSLETVGALFGLEEYLLGGRLSILGSAPPLGTEGPLTARVEVDDVTVIQLPILARILAAGSFQGLAALLNGDGISFDLVEADIAWEDGLLTIGDARAGGNSLGVTAAGTIDFASEHAAIDGNLAPSYVVNSLLGDVPVIGDILVSRPGEGVIGITYSVEGPFDSLTVFANPLSALAPGVLRRLFEGTAADRAARERAEDAANAQAGTPEDNDPSENPDAPDDTQPQSGASNASEADERAPEAIEPQTGGDAPE